VLVVRHTDMKSLWACDSSAHSSPAASEQWSRPSAALAVAQRLSDLKSAVFALTEAIVRIDETDIGRSRWARPWNVSSCRMTTGTNGDWRVGFWGNLRDDERRLPRETLAYRLTRNARPATNPASGAKVTLRFWQSLLERRT
jgi:hypothetical protein